MAQHLCSRRLICVAALGLSLIPFLQTISSYNNVAAQGQFAQNLLVHINKGNYVIGNYGIIISNGFTGENSRPSLYTDSEGSPSMVDYRNVINAYDGNLLTACVMIIATEAIACDSQYANSFVNPLEFNIDMNTATQVYGGGVDQFRP